MNNLYFEIRKIFEPKFLWTILCVVSAILIGCDDSKDLIDEPEKVTNLCTIEEVAATEAIFGPLMTQKNINWSMSTNTRVTLIHSNGRVITAAFGNYHYEDYQYDSKGRITRVDYFSNTGSFKIGYSVITYQDNKIIDEFTGEDEESKSLSGRYTYHLESGRVKSYSREYYMGDLLTKGDSLVYEYVDGNVVDIFQFVRGNGSTPFINTHFFLEYDNKTSPYNTVQHSGCSDLFSFVNLSKNNVVSVTINGNSEPYYHYSYTYNNNFPTEIRYFKETVSTNILNAYMYNCE